MTNELISKYFSTRIFHWGHRVFVWSLFKCMLKIQYLQWEIM